MIDLVGTRGIDAQVFHPVGRSFVVVAGNVTRLAGQLSSRSVGGNLEILQPRHGQPQFSWREAAKPTAMRVKAAPFAVFAAFIRRPKAQLRLG